MKQRITFATDPQRQTASLLLHFTIVLHQLRIHPIAFTLEASPERGEDTIWVIVIRNGPNFREFLSALEGTEGVRHLATTVVPTLPTETESPGDSS